MRILIAVVLWTALGVQAATVVDLDEPGALGALKRDNPEHYALVVRAMDKVQAVPYEARGQHNLFLDGRKPDPTRRQIEASQPAKTRLMVPIGDVNYRITVMYLKNPATVHPAK
jgi:hypothetical protein